MHKNVQKNGIGYHREGDYYLPNLTLPEAPNIGFWGQLRREFLWENHAGIYTGMLLAGTLHTHLAEIDTQAEQMLETIINRLKTQEGVTEELKAENQMEWVRRMTNIQARARETVLNELIRF